MTRWLDTTRRAVPGLSGSCAMLFALLVAVSLSATVPGALAQEDPGQPVNIYGTAVDEAGNEVPPGTTIDAVVDGEIRDSLTVEEAGVFGGPGAFDESLAVSTGAGAEVVFTVDGVDGPTALETLSLGGGDDVVELNLTFPGETFAGSPDPTGLSLSLAETTLDVDTTTTATVTATFEDGTGSNVTGVAELESLDTDVATVSDGTIVGEAAGTAGIRAEYTVGGTTVTDTLAVTVRADPAALVDLSLSLAETSLANGTLTDATVTAVFADGSESEVTDTATVESLNPETATVDDGVVVGESAGTATVQAVYTAGTVTETDTVTLSVTEETAELVGVTLAPARRTVETGETTAAMVTAAFSNGSETVVTDTATVASLDPETATVDDGVITGESAGTATIEAAFGGATDTVELTIEPVAEAVFEVGPLDVPSTAVPGESLTVTATVANVGEAPGSVSLTYTLTGAAEVERTLDIELDPGSTETVSFSPTAPDSAGDIDHTLDVPGDSSTATTTVEPGDSGDDTDDGGGGGDGTGDDGTGDDGTGDDGTGDDGTGDDGTGGDGTGDDGTGGDGTGDDGTGGDGTGDDGTGGDGTGDDGTGGDGTGDDGTGGDGTGDDGTGGDGTGDGTGDDGTGGDGTGDDGASDSGTGDDGTGDSGDGGDGFGSGFGVLVVVVAVLGVLFVRLRRE